MSSSIVWPPASAEVTRPTYLLFNKLRSLYGSSRSPLNPVSTTAIQSCPATGSAIVGTTSEMILANNVGLPFASKGTRKNNFVF